MKLKFFDNQLLFCKYNLSEGDWQVKQITSAAFIQPKLPLHQLDLFLLNTSPVVLLVCV